MHVKTYRKSSLQKRFATLVLTQHDQGDRFFNPGAAANFSRGGVLRRTDRLTHVTSQKNNRRESFNDPPVLEFHAGSRGTRQVVGPISHRLRVSLGPGLQVTERNGGREGIRIGLLAANRPMNLTASDANPCHSWCLRWCALPTGDHTGHPPARLLRRGYGTKYDTKTSAARRPCDGKQAS
jgi:hypothetical protein